MASQEDIKHQQQLLEINRGNLALYLRQRDLMGGEAYVTPVVANGIREARANIKRIKDILRGWGVSVENGENDGDAPGAAPATTASAPAGDPAPIARATGEPEASGTAPRPRRLRAFLCHSSGDKPAVRDLYRRLLTEGVDPWLDEENLLPGQDWGYEIKRAVRASDVVLVCLSRASVSKAGYVQKEIKLVLDVADQQPEGAIFLIPVKLEACEVPDRLSTWQWVDLFEERGFERLMRALRARAQAIGATIGPPA